MNEAITIYEKPTCSTCRETIKILESKGVPFEKINYILDPLTAEELRAISKKLQGPVHQLIRTKEPLYNELGLNEREISDEEAIAILAEHPSLLQRPIVVKGDRAIVARPATTIEALFQD